MLRFRCASTRSVRALAASAALAAPLALAPAASAASADHDSRSRDYERGSYGHRSIGTIRIDGRAFAVTSHHQAASQIAAAFCRLGYDAWADCETVIVRTRRGGAPSFRFDGRGYDLCSSWRGDCLVLDLERIDRRDYAIAYTPRTIVIKRGGEQTGGVCHPTCRTLCGKGVVTIRGGPRDDPDWGRRHYDGDKPRHLDQGWGRRWNDSCDTGFNIRWNWDSRKR